MINNNSMDKNNNIDTSNNNNKNNINKNITNTTFIIPNNIAVHNNQKQCSAFTLTPPVSGCLLSQSTPANPCSILNM